MSLVVGRPELAGDWRDPTVLKKIFHISFIISGFNWKCNRGELVMSSKPGRKPPELLASEPEAVATGPGLDFHESFIGCS